MSSHGRSNWKVTSGRDKRAVAGKHWSGFGEEITASEY